MRKLIAAVIAVILNVTAFGYGMVATPAYAGNQQNHCNKQVDPTCATFQRQMEAPAYNGPKAQGGPVRCVWVTNNEPVALVLREGDGTTGDPIISWRLASLNWTPGYVNGHAGYVTQVCFSQSLLYAFDVVTLCAQLGHSVWRNADMAYVRTHDVKRSDPACVGGKSWCNLRGL